MFPRTCNAYAPPHPQACNTHAPTFSPAPATKSLVRTRAPRRGTPAARPLALLQRLRAPSPPLAPARVRRRRLRPPATGTTAPPAAGCRHPRAAAAAAATAAAATVRQLGMAAAAAAAMGTCRRRRIGPSPRQTVGVSAPPVVKPAVGAGRIGCSRWWAPVGQAVAGGGCRRDRL
eukprot:202508-Chlamydomonas_euryale.AAC.2